MWFFSKPYSSYMVDVGCKKGDDTQQNEPRWPCYCKLLCSIALDISLLLLIILDSCVFVINLSLKEGEVVWHNRRGAALQHIAVRLQNIAHIRCFFMNIHLHCLSLLYTLCMCLFQASSPSLHHEGPVAGCASILQENKGHEKVRRESPGGGPEQIKKKKR